MSARALVGLPHAGNGRIFGIVGPLDAINHDHCIGRRRVGAGRLDVDQLDREVRVGPVSSHGQVRLDLFGHAHRLVQQRRLEHQHVEAGGQGQLWWDTAEEVCALYLIEAAAEGNRFQAGEVSADRGIGLAWVEAETQGRLVGPGWVIRRLLSPCR